MEIKEKESGRRKGKQEKKSKDKQTIEEDLNILRNSYIRERTIRKTAEEHKTKIKKKNHKESKQQTLKKI